MKKSKTETFELTPDELRQVVIDHCDGDGSDEWQWQVKFHPVEGKAGEFYALVQRTRTT